MAAAPIYAVRPSDVYSGLETTPEGLSSEEAAARLSLYGPNALREPPPQPTWRKFTRYSTHPMAILLWVAGVLAFGTAQPVMGIVIWVVVVINAVFSFMREYRAEQAVSALKHLLPAHARVIRDGTETKVLADQVVPGDVLVLAEGDNVPADARVVEEYGLRTNDSTLTGDAVPARKTAAAMVREGLSDLERPNLVFAGTSIYSGTGRAVVTATGMLTQFGRIANLTQAVKEEPSLLQQSLQRLTRIISVLAIGLGVIVFAVDMVDAGASVINSFIFAIGIIVATVPEGLIPTVTLALAMAVQRLTKRGVLVKKLSDVETLGTTSVICTDKSGTLTQNQMTVREVWVDGKRLSVSGVGYDPAGKFSDGSVDPTVVGDLRALLSAGSLCNNSRLNAPTSDHPLWTCLGDQTEAALRVVARKAGLNEDEIQIAQPRIHEIPFDARRKRMSTIHRDPTGETAFVKGAPKEVLQLCTHVLLRGEVRPLDAATRAEIIAANDDYARNALRVLAFARRKLPPRAGVGVGAGAYSAERVEQGLTFLGLAAMMDPPRPEIAEAVRTCREAGIRIVMITGDYGLTAESVARRVGMLSSPSPRILTGADVDAMSDEELQAALAEEVVCARMAPEHKLRLVAAFQARGDVVAVSGDGVNDAPALRKADVGIAMGVTGTDVAKEAADVILTDDNFAAIAVAIAEGRAVYDNLRKFMTYIFASNLTEIVPFVLSALFKIPLALTIMQILAIDLGTDLLPAMALGAEKPEPGVMRRPIKRGRAMLDAQRWVRLSFFLGLVQTVLCYAGFFFVYYQFGYTDFLHLPRFDQLPFLERLATPSGQVYVLATTVFHAGVVTAQIGNAFACRTLKAKTRQLGWLSNPYLLGAIGFEIVLILALIYLQPLSAWFEHLPLPPIYWLGLGLYAPILYVVAWVRKGIVRRRDRQRDHQGGATV